jgi:CubicO group peptidase (beta-lactamase class C family)
MQNGVLLYQNFFGHPVKVQSVQSVTKSITSLAVGDLLKEHPETFSLDELMSDWVPAWKSDSQKSQITLRMILSHTSGLPEGEEVINQPDTVAYAENLPLQNTPGTAYVYSDAGAALLDLVISQVSGMKTDQYVKSRIFDPLRISEWSWDSDQAGNVETCGGLFMKPTDLLSIGQMMLAKGFVNGQSIVPSGRGSSG